MEQGAGNTGEDSIMHNSNQENDPSQPSTSQDEHTSREPGSMEEDRALLIEDLESAVEDDDDEKVIALLRQGIKNEGSDSVACILEKLAYYIYEAVEDRDSDKSETLETLVECIIDDEEIESYLQGCFVPEDSPFYEALLYAARSGVYKLLKLLCTVKNINVDHMYTHDQTALMEAAESGKKDIIKLLVSYGADPNLKNSQGKIALTYALLEGDIECARFLFNKHRPSYEDLKMVAKSVVEKGRPESSLRFLAQHNIEWKENISTSSMVSDPSPDEEGDSDDLHDADDDDSLKRMLENEAVKWNNF